MGNSPHDDAWRFGAREDVTIKVLKWHFDSDRAIQERCRRGVRVW